MNLCVALGAKTIVYSAAWEGKPREVFVHRLESPESRAFGSEGDVFGSHRLAGSDARTHARG